MILTGVDLLITPFDIDINGATVVARRGFHHQWDEHDRLHFYIELWTAHHAADDPTVAYTRCIIPADAAVVVDDTDPLSPIHWEAP